MARLLGFQPKAFAYIIYQMPPTVKYTTFTIPKASGGTRTIKAPEKRLKNVQARISELLQDCISDINAQRNQKEKLSHGFRRGHSIMSNAYEHRGRHFVLNVDLEDFFGAINFGRVRGFFMKNKSFALSERTATILAHIVCDRNSLPQGAPTSPVVSNLVTHILDVRLAKLARRCGVHYTRYADDLTFSTNRRTFPDEVAAINADGKWVAGAALLKVITQAGFTLNAAKTRMQLQQSRQDVTGLVVNEKVNVRSEYFRETRAKCDRLFKTGKYVKKVATRSSDGSVKVTEQEGTLDQLAGVLSFIDQVKKFKTAPNKKKDERLSGAEWLYCQFLSYRHFYAPLMPVVVCEGKTDNIYIRCALEALARSYPTLAKQEKTKVELKIRLFRYTEITRRLMGIAGGSGNFKRLISKYSEIMKPFTAKVERFPVILLVDNDSGAKDIYSCVKEKTKKSTVDGTESFYYLVDNLYVVPTPLTESGGQTVIEDFLPSKSREEKLGGKTLYLGNGNLDTKKHYGKSLFAEHVIWKKRKEIDFTKMKPILDRIALVVEDYANKP